MSDTVVSSVRSNKKNPNGSMLFEANVISGLGFSPVKERRCQPVKSTDFEEVLYNSSHSSSGEATVPIQAISLITTAGAPDCSGWGEGVGEELGEGVGVGVGVEVVPPPPPPPPKPPPPPPESPPLETMSPEPENDCTGEELG